MSKYSKLLKNTAWVFCGSMGCRMLQFLLLPYLTAWLTPAEYGVKDLQSPDSFWSSWPPLSTES